MNMVNLILWQQLSEAYKYLNETNQNEYITMGHTFVSSLLLQLLWYIGGSPPVLRDREDLRQRKCYTINIKTSYLPFQFFDFLCSLPRIQIHQDSTNLNTPAFDLSGGCLWSMVTWPRVALWSPDSTWSPVIRSGGHSKSCVTVQVNTWQL